MSLRNLIVASLALLPAAGAYSVRGADDKKTLHAVDETMVQPLRFDQKLLVCNAYPSHSPVVIKKNENELLADENEPLSFRECRYLKGQVQQHDRLDLGLRDQELHGTFEVGELPSNDAVLLLVLEKREGSVLMGFQSFAFPSHTEDKDAQLAVINTFKGNSSAPHLKMEDHITGKEKQTVSKRIEQLNFNRVYAVEEGNYDASIADRSRGAEVEHVLEQSTRKALHLSRSQNYVILRTGGDSAEFPEGLTVYPQSPMHESGASRFAATGLAVVLASLFAFTA
jgi:hypothetical protein